MIFRRKSQNEQELIFGCVKGKSTAQKQLYENYFNYAMSVALRYVSGRDEAIEVVNDGFLKVFDGIKNYDISKPFKAWLRQIVVFTAIDQFRRTRKHQHESIDQMYIDQYVDPSIFHTIGEEEILSCVQKLPPSYRMVFVLHAVEGYKHHEIASLLKISEGTSKSNLAVARGKLQQLLLKSENYRNHG